MAPGSGIVRPTRADPLVRAASEGIGGPSGDRSRGHWWWTPVRVVLAVAALAFVLGMVQKTPCVRDNWTGDKLRYGAMCYSDVPYLYPGRGFAAGYLPYADNGGRYPAMEYPVVIGYFAYTAARVTQVLDGVDVSARANADQTSIYGQPGVTEEAGLYFKVTAILLAPFALLAAWFLAGVIGLGTATKLYPLFLLGALLVVCLRRGRLPAFAAATAAAAVTWLLVNAPAMLYGFAQWKVFWSFNGDRGADLGSIWLVIQQRGHTVTPHLINVVSAVFFVAVCVGVLVLGLRARRTPRIPQLAFLIVAGFLLVNKVYSPQYVLWLLPLAVLARPRWRDLLVWTAGEVLYFGAVWLNLGGWTASASSGVPDQFYALAILIRMAAELYLVVMVVRDILQPWQDPVRADGLTDDPAEPSAVPAA